MTLTSTIPASTSADFTGVGQKAFRDRLRSALHEVESSFQESHSFWDRFRSAFQASSNQTLVFTDLSSLAKQFQECGIHAWTASVRRTQPFFVAFVRTERDKGYAGLIDDLLRACDMRLNVCDDASNWNRVFSCVTAGVSGTRRDGLVDVRYLARPDSLMVSFGDGFTGLVTWADLGIEDLKSTLIPESATVNSTLSAIELSTADDDLFEIDSGSVRAVLDESYSSELQRRARKDDESVGVRVRRAREAASLTQPQLSQKTGLDQAVISRIERGKVRPRIDTLRRLAGGLGLTVSQLLATQ